MLVPQLPQNLDVTGLFVLHSEQAMNRLDPQVPQNLTLAGLFVLHFGHCMIISYLKTQV